MAKQSIRFCVADGNKRAQVWNVSASKNTPDVYISTRNLGTIHASFHGTGKWHVKFGDIEEKRRVSFGQEVKDSYLQKWERPEPTKPHVTVAFRILTLWGTPQKVMREEKKEFVAIPNAKPEHAIEIMILFVSAGKEFVAKNATTVGSLTLSNAEQVFIVYKEISAEDRAVELPTKIPDFSDRVTFRDLFKGNLGIIAHGTASDGSRVMWDIAIRVTFFAYIKILFKKIKNKLRV